MTELNHEFFLKLSKGTGYRPPEKADPRNLKLEELGLGAPPASLPASFKTDMTVIPRLMQGQRSACVEHAVAKAVMYKEFKNTGQVTLLSPRFLAALTVKMDGFPLSQGTNLENALKIARQTGICEDKYFPNDVTLSDADYCDISKIPPEAYANAALHKIDSYAFVSNLSLTGVHTAIMQNDLVIVGMKICDSWWTSLSGFVTWAASAILPLRPPKGNSDPSISGHALLWHGWDATPFEYVDNEWSEGWGSNGFGWFGSNDWPYVYECVVINVLTPQQLQQIQQANKIVDTVDKLHQVETPQNSSLIAQIISQLWARFIYLFNPSPTLGGVPRSSKWPEVRAQFLKNNKTCAACGTDKLIQCHHVVAYHTHPELELESSNFLPLCEGMERNCHRFVGHLDNFQSINESSRKDAADWLKRIQTRPKWDGTKWNYPVDSTVGS